MAARERRRAAAESGVNPKGSGGFPQAGFTPAEDVKEKGPPESAARFLGKCHDPCVVHRAVPVIEAAAALGACEVLGI